MAKDAGYGTVRSARSASAHAASMQSNRRFGFEESYWEVRFVRQVNRKAAVDLRNANRDQHRSLAVLLGEDERTCLLALLVGQALIRVIHGNIAKSAGIPIASLAWGCILGGCGVWQRLRAREAIAHHVPSGLFSGIEHVFDLALVSLMTLVAVLAVSGGTLALAGRKMSSAVRQPHARGT